MLDFSPTEEQEAICQLARSIAMEQLRPQGRAAEKQGDISPTLAQTIVQTGLTTPFPEMYGGSGPLEAVTYALIAEELGCGDGGLAMNIIASMMGPVAVTLAGNQRQQETYVFPFCNGPEGAKERGCLAFAERTGGFTLADINTTARRVGDHLVLNGTKRAVIHGDRANQCVVLFRMEGTTGNNGIGACILPAQMEGLSVTVEEHRLGLLAAPSASYSLNDVTVPQDAVLGEPGSDEVVRVAALYMILRSGIACGIVRAALEYAGAYAQERIAFGRPIVSYQGIAFMLAEMAMKLDAVRLLLWNAAASWDQKAEREKLVWDAEAAQRQAIALCKSATTDAIQIMGGAGFMQDHPAEMWMRNAAAME